MRFFLALLVDGALGGVVLGWGLAGAKGGACFGVLGFAVVWNRLVLRQLVGRSLISLIMVTFGSVW
jgi:hypothetical protein